MTALPADGAKGQSLSWLVPLQWLAHFADEWWFGFPAWATRHFAPLPESPWLMGMSVLTVALLLLGRAASRPGAVTARLACAGVQMLFFANALFHLGATFVFGEYSPGTASGVLLFLPLSPLVWRAAAGAPGVTRRGLATALVAGFVLHALVLASLFVDKSGWGPG